MNKAKTIHRSALSMKIQDIQLQPVFDLTAYEDGFMFVSASFGYDGNLYILLIDQIPERERGMFVQSDLQQKRVYKVLIVDSVQNAVHGITTLESHFNLHYAQPLGEELLLVGARSRYYGQDRYDLNGKIVDRDGQLLHELLLGDGIERVQTSVEGNIWTSYFDEGVFGNFGWYEPVGAPGLIAWNRQGQQIYVNTKADIADCYALNVVSDQEVWFYYYTDFKVGRITDPYDQPQVSLVETGLSGSHVVATNGTLALFQSGYNKKGQYVLLQLHGDKLSLVRQFSFVSVDGEADELHVLDGRKDQLLFKERSHLYMVSLDELTDGWRK
ncbi:hypothetical protein [Paenibacillus sp. DCT19]|uniref:hypothetical protein n=1 Tax=Paenibacillus sp. DCT19 TaxID=2211212 RepID=UPI0020C29F0E|nr:hypothetical protein [Paenibacillus sp. DCT19]